VDYRREKIEKLVAIHNMLYELIMCLARRSNSLASFPNISISYVREVIKDEKTIQQFHGDLTCENATLELNL
jgi:hypothetical protein